MKTEAGFILSEGDGNPSGIYCWYVLLLEHESIDTYGPFWSLDEATNFKEDVVSESSQISQILEVPYYTSIQISNFKN